MDETKAVRTQEPELSAGPAERSTKYYVLILVVVLLMAETTTFTGIVFYNALPYMATTFSAAQLPWVITVTFLVGAPIMPLIGKLADIHGSKRVLLVVAGVFVVGSLVGAVTTSFLMLMVARVLQAPVLALPGVYYACFRQIFPKRVVPIAIGMIATGIGVGAVVTPLISGALLAAFSYHSIFWFCLIYAVVLAPVVYVVVPDSVRQGARRLDVAGAVLLSVGVGLLLFGVTKGPSSGWTSPTTLLSFVGAVVLLVGFTFAELRSSAPMIDLRLLTGPAVRTTLLISLTAGVVIGSWGYVIPQMLETPSSPGANYGFGLTATKVGLVALSAGIAGMACGPLGGFLSRRNSPRMVMLWSCAILVVAPLLLAFEHDQLWFYVVFGLLQGIGNGFYFAATPNLIIEAVPEHLTGVSGGMVSLTSALAGGVMPVVISVILLQNILHVDPATHAVVFASAGYSYALVVIAACAAVALVLTAFMRHGRLPATGGAVSGH